jgi:GDP-4-dehydro-6-deoxy-D-mannose reductase
MKALITGITGMIGSHLALVLRNAGWEVVGVARSSAASRLDPKPPTSIFRCDILDLSAMRDIVSAVKPDAVIHLAAQAFNGISWKTEQSTHSTNYFGTLNVLQCCRDIVPRARVVLACSSAEYGLVPLEECPLKEDRPLRPVSPYGVSKVAVECMGNQYLRTHGLPVLLPRLFIHVGTGHPPLTAIQNFARQLALISIGALPPVLNVGPLDTARDFIDVRDGVAGIVLLLEKGEPGIPVNVCTGTAYTIREVLQMLIEISGLKVEVRQDPSLSRPADEPVLIGDNSRLKALGWQQRYTMRETLEVVYEDWLRRTNITDVM